MVPLVAEALFMFLVYPCQNTFEERASTIITVVVVVGGGLVFLGVMVWRDGEGAAAAS